MLGHLDVAPRSRDRQRRSGWPGVVGAVVGVVVLCLLRAVRELGVAVVLRHVERGDGDGGVHLCGVGLVELEGGG